MRQLIVYTISRKQAHDAMPWACKIVKVDGGYMGFESIDDYNTWISQR